MFDGQAPLLGRAEQRCGGDLSLHAVSQSFMLDVQGTVFVVDDDASVREALERLVRSAGLNVQAFASSEEFLKHPRVDAPSCLVLDVRLPNLSGLDLQRQMADAQNEIPIIFITGQGDIPTTVRAMKAGALEFLTKPLVERDVLESIRQAIERDRSARSEHADTAELRARYASLTPREAQVMDAAVSGLLNKQIAGELGISEETVKVHRGHAMRKMKADSLAGLVRMSEKLRRIRGTNP
jgi:FixJ family two-component response regulator